MENNVAEEPLNQIEVGTLEGVEGSTREVLGCSAMQTPSQEVAAPGNVRLLIRSLIERYRLTREQLISIYDEYVSLTEVKAAAGGAAPAGGEGGGSITGAEGECQQDGEENMDAEEQFDAEVGKMQNLVRSAMHSYETSPVTSELGVKRKMFSLEEELNMKPTSFAQELLE